ncbi:MAG: hypothetical protein AAF203_05415 [Pseudomonadota bacterium]
MRIRFVRLKKSELVREAIEDRMAPLLKKYKGVNEKDVFIEVEMENSPHQAGRDLFRLKFNIKEGELRGFILEKSDINFYRALSSLANSLPANINRFRARRDRKSYNRIRKLKTAAGI